MQEIRMRDVISEAARLEHLAEECTELAQAALKLARFQRNENPVDRPLAELRANLVEELTDVMVIASELPYRPDWEIEAQKRQRIHERLKRREEDEEGLRMASCLVSAQEPGGGCCPRKEPSRYDSISGKRP